MKKFLVLAVTAGLAAAGSCAFAAVTDSKSYKISVTIPASVLLVEPGPRISAAPEQNLTIARAQIRQEVQWEEVKRSDEIVMLKTVVVK